VREERRGDGARRRAGKKKIIDRPRERRIDGDREARANSLRLSRASGRLEAASRGECAREELVPSVETAVPFLLPSRRLSPTPLSLHGSRARLRPLEPSPRPARPAGVVDACSRLVLSGERRLPSARRCRLTTSRSYPLSFLLFLQTSGSTLPSLNYLL